MARRIPFGIGIAALFLVAASEGHATQIVVESPAAASLATPPPGARSPRNANYSIDATLDPERQLIHGRETIAWRNITPNPTVTLRFHLYWNAWKNTRSTWMRERILARTADDLVARPPDDWAWIEVGSIRLLQQGATPFVDLTPSRRYVAPDDGNTSDETLLEVPLPAPVGPGQTITLEVEWQAHVPRTFRRTGRIDRFYFLAQWFPKIAVLDATGWRGHQFHASTEFFADYGVYDVRLRVPHGWVVGATGRERERRDNGDGTSTHRYVEEDVHDFAWTTSPDMREFTARFEHRGLPSVDLRLLLQPEHVGQEEQHFVATRAALRHYGEWFGAYPYDHLTIVDPAWQSEAGGMEYPTLFTAGTRWLVPRTGVQPERVTIHEAGHQFWYGVIGTNEVEHAWMDEGINQYAAARTMEQALSPRHHTDRLFHGFLPWVYDDIVLDRADHEGLDAYRQSPDADVPATPSWRYFPATSSRITYNKTALWLHTLERMLGWERLQRAMSTFFQRHRFTHPGPAEFFAVASDVSGRDLTWFFDQVYRSSNTFDYAVSDLQSRPAAVRGYVNRSGSRTFVSDGDREGPFETLVIVQRRGSAVFPVDVQVTFADGERVRERWDGRDRWRAFQYVRQVRARSAQVDPDRVLRLDVDATNNSRSLEPRGQAAATKWSLKWLVWLQDLFMTYGFFL